MIDRKDLSDSEYVFLVSQKILPSQLFDARGRNATSWGDEAKSQGYLFGLGIPCLSGHRIRLRSGHCCQCDTSRIAYIRRHSAPGFVYIASSTTGKIHKVGSCSDIAERQTRLNYDSYAGFDDWKIIAFAKSQSMGAVEFDIHRALEDERIDRSYKKSGSTYIAREVFKDLRKVWSAYRTATLKIDAKEKWQIRNIMLYDF
ncbi:GIY-YIG nuclease family protein [Tabrizicola sp.]|uniref:GIY-YIG nuclease family protein n=1 Tax=Tabrizicola sp. TaxID=2005166 RepID=UPI0035B3C881